MNPDPQLPFNLYFKFLLVKLIQIRQSNVRCIHLKQTNCGTTELFRRFEINEGSTGVELGCVGLQEILQNSNMLDH